MLIFGQKPHEKPPDVNINMVTMGMSNYEYFKN